MTHIKITRPLLPLLLILALFQAPFMALAEDYEIDNGTGEASGIVQQDAIIAPILGRDVTMFAEFSNDGISFTSDPLQFIGNQVIYYRIGFENTAPVTFESLIITVGWSFESEIVAQFVGGSASRALGEINPVIDMSNSNITWTIPSLPGNTIGSLTFQFLTDLEQDPSGAYELYVQPFASDFNTTLPGNQLIAEVLYDTEMWFNLTYLPQGRYGDPLTNNQTRLTVEIRPPGGSANSILLSEQVVTNSQGYYPNLLILGLSPGNYDVTAKGWANLRQKLNVDLNPGVNNLDFSQGYTQEALAGDVDNNSRSGSGSLEQGNNEIEISDYSTIVGVYDQTNDRYDLDQFEDTASAPDYSLMVSNYGATGIP